MLSNLKYSYQWALDVVYGLTDKHTRATEIVCEFYDISPRILALFLAKGDPMWIYLRDRIKAITALEERTNRYYTDVEIFDWLKRLSTEKYAGKLADRLDNGQKKARIKEQSFQGGAPSAGMGALPVSERTEWGVQYLMEF